MNKDICPICGVDKGEGTTSFTVDFHSGVAAVRDVPATICGQCGEEWLSDETTKNLKKLPLRLRSRIRKF